MARKHSKKRGKSGSKRPPTKTAPEWVEMSAGEVEELVSEMAKQGYDSPAIGLKLRDEYGIPSVRNLSGKKVEKIMKESGQKLTYPVDLLNLIKKAVRMRKHLQKNITDTSNKKKLNDTESKIKSLVKYYRETGKLPEDWRYNPEKAALIVK